MAIRRCPYCKAIIDEADKYCNNCGTQLLFPEDEYVEEEIPGDKIIEEEEEEEESEEEEEELGSGGEEDDEEEEEEDLLEEDEEGVGFAERGKAGEKAAEEVEEAEEEFEEELEEEEGEEVITTEKFGVEEEEKAGEGIEKPGEKARGEFIKAAEEKELRKKYEVALEDDELIFKTKDLEGLTKTVEEGKKEVDRLMASARDTGEEETGEETGESEEIPGKEETRDDLPPWASGMKGVPPAVIETGEEESGEKTASKATTSHGWTADSGIGVPERVTQTDFPSTDTVLTGRAAEEEAEEKEEKEEDEGFEFEEAREELEEERREERALKKEVRIKAKFVDLIFITALWLISLWFTAGVIGVSIFRLFVKSPLHVFGFYLILLLLYFFLFLYFLGETLGDHYFSEED